MNNTNLQNDGVKGAYKQLLKAPLVEMRWRSYTLADHWHFALVVALKGSINAF